AAALDSVSTLSVAQMQSTAAFLELHPDLSQADFQRLSRVLLADHPVVAVSFIEAKGMTSTGQLGRGRHRPSDWQQVFPVKLRSSFGPESLIRPADAGSAL